MLGGNVNVHGGVRREQVEVTDDDREAAVVPWVFVSKLNDGAVVRVPTLLPIEG